MDNSFETREHHLVCLYVVACEIDLKSGKNMYHLALFKIVFLHFPSAADQ